MSAAPLRYYHNQGGFGDRHGYAQRTRFLPDQVVAMFDRCVTPALGDADDDPRRLAIDLTSETVRRRTKGL